MGSLREVALPKTTMRIPKFRETVQEDDDCKRWWIKAMELGTGLRDPKMEDAYFDPEAPSEHADSPTGLGIVAWFGREGYGDDRLVEEGGTRRRGPTLSRTDQIAVWDEFTEETYCRLLDIFQNLDCGERTKGGFEVSGNQIDYEMKKLFQIGNRPWVSSGFSISSDVKKLQEKDIPLVHLAAIWKNDLIDAAKLCFAELFEHLGIELE